MADERLPESLQLSVLAALAFDAGQGAAIAAQVTASHFDGVWRDFAAKVLLYRKRYGKPPGQNYIEDLADLVSIGKDSSLLKTRLIPALMLEVEGLNVEYVSTRVQDFVRRQVLKGALFKAGDRFAQDNEQLVEDVEGILHEALQFRQNTYDAGTFLNDPNALSFLDHTDNIISLGIPELDKLRIGLIPKQLLLFIAPKGAGKSWFCIHCGKQALLQRQKVVHYTLEMDGDLEVIPRYYQSLFGVANNSERYTRTELEFDDLGRLSGFKGTQAKPHLNFTEARIRTKLRKKMASFGTRFGNLVVKTFPTSTATMGQLISHLDYLAEVKNFVPNVMIVDYPKLMKVDRNNLRTDIGQNMEELRGLAQKRNMAMVAPHQGTRATIGAKRTRSKDAGEDISVVQTADTTLSYSRTEAEEKLGLGRIAVEHTRKAHGGSMILLSQGYTIGQFVLSSALMQKAYWDKMKTIKGGTEDDD